MEADRSGGNLFGNVMNLLEEAVLTYQKTGGKWEDDVAAYATHGGYLYVSPECVILGKPVRRDGGVPEGQWNVANPDAWFVKYAGGRGHVSKFIDLIPFPLPWVGWARQTKGKAVKWFNFNQIKRRK